jgi:hypothetical protein
MRDAELERTTEEKKRQLQARWQKSGKIRDDKVLFLCNRCRHHHNHLYSLLLLSSL